jgi:hypothetical protein
MSPRIQIALVGAAALVGVLLGATVVITVARLGPLSTQPVAQ